MNMPDISRTELEHLIDEWIIGHNAERNRNILKSRFIDGLTFEQLSCKYDLSVQCIKAVVYKEWDRVLKHIK